MDTWLAHMPQADAPRKNHLALLKLTNLGQGRHGKRDKKGDESSSEDESDEEEEMSDEEEGGEEKDPPRMHHRWAAHEWAVHHPFVCWLYTYSAHLVVLMRCLYECTTYS